MARRSSPRDSVPGMGTRSSGRGSGGGYRPPAAAPAPRVTLALEADVGERVARRTRVGLEERLQTGPARSSRCTCGGSRTSTRCGAGWGAHGRNRPSVSHSRVHESRTRRDALAAGRIEPIPSTSRMRRHERLDSRHAFLSVAARPPEGHCRSPPESCSTLPHGTHGPAEILPLRPAVPARRRSWSRWTAAVVGDENFGNILMDVAVLWSLEHPHSARARAAAAQIRRWLADAVSASPRTSRARASPNADTLQLALTAANRLTHEILEGLSAADLRARRARTRVIAHPWASCAAIDHLFTGRVERIDARAAADACSCQRHRARGATSGHGRRRPHLPHQLGRGGGGGGEALCAVKLVYITTVGRPARQRAPWPASWRWTSWRDARWPRGTVAPDQVSRRATR